MILIRSGDREVNNMKTLLEHIIDSGAEVVVMNSNLELGLGKFHDKEYDKAFTYFQEAVKQGNAEAEYMIATMYDKGYGVERNFKKSFQFYKSSGEKGFAESQYNTGVAYEFGEGVKRDHKNAVYWYKKAVSQQHKLAEFNLGVMYRMGKGGLKQNPQRAFELFYRSAKQEYPIAQHQLATMYLHGEGVEKDSYEAYKWFNEAAKQGHEDSKEIVHKIKAISLGLR